MGLIADVDGAVVLTPVPLTEGPAWGLVVTVTLGDITGLIIAEDGAVGCVLLLEDVKGTLELDEGGPIEKIGREAEDCVGGDCDVTAPPEGADTVVGDVEGGVASG